MTERRVSKARITIDFLVPLGTTREMIADLASRALVQIEEPVVGYDDSGNEIMLEWTDILHCGYALNGVGADLRGTTERQSFTRGR